MARFRNTVSGVVVDVDELAAARLPGSWEALDASQEEEPRKTTRKRTSSRKKSADDEDTNDE